MTISAVSSLQYSSSYNYDTNTQYKYFGFAVSDERLKQLMSQYGIIQTGNSQMDLDALYQAMYPNAVSEATTTAKSNLIPQQASQQNKTAETAGSTANLPWSDIMGQVGLAPTGDFVTDYTAFSDKLTTMQASATTQDQKASIGLLQAEAAIVFVQPNEPVKLASAAQSMQQQPQSQVTGADIQAQLNRMFLSL